MWVEEDGKIRTRTTNNKQESRSGYERVAKDGRVREGEKGRGWETDEAYLPLYCIQSLLSKEESLEKYERGRNDSM